MKTKSLAALVLGMVVVAALAAGAGAGSAKLLQADLSIRPGVALAGHPRALQSHFLGAFDAALDPGSSHFFYRLEYKGLVGSVFRVEIRSRATGAVYATVCAPCHPTSGGPGRDGLPVRKLSGTVAVDPDVGYLIAGNRTFVEVDTTAYPAGEIGGPILRYVAPPNNGGGVLQPPTTEPRCC